ncbi:MAG: hypothetical protein K0R84_174 [Clostridia bacterium]|jgi:hypothetical protein|nr:hypothetical protein [Clostridia bacterium]
MHDSFLLHRIADSLQRICDENRLDTVRELVLDVSTDSHIEALDLKEHLIELLPYLIDKNTVITIRKTAIEEQSTVIYLLKGDSLEK